MIEIKAEASWKLNNIQLKERDKFVHWINNGNKITYIERCPFCFSNNFIILSNVDRFGLNFQSLKCNSCNLVITNPHIKEEYLPEYYNNFYHSLIFGDYEAKDFLFNLNQGRKIFNYIKPFLLKEKKVLTVFEIGAGSGSNLKSFSESAKKLGYKTILSGLEFSNTYIEKAKKDNIVLYSDDLSNYVNKNNITYDIIILSHVFEHVNNLENFIQNVKKLMNSESILYLEVPGILEMHKNIVYKGIFQNYLVHAHLYHFTAETLEKILLKNGFELKYINEKVESVFKISKTKMIPKIKSDINKYLKNLENYKFLYKIQILINKIVTKYLRIIKK